MLIKKAVAAVAVCIGVVLSSAFTAACTDKYENVSNDVENYFTQPVALKSGESFTFDVNAIYADSGIEFEKYEILPNANYSVKGNKITARGTGVCGITVELFSKKTNTRYYTTLGNLYSYDEKDLTPVTTAKELAEMRLDGNYILKADIDLSGIADWEPVGNTPAGSEFTGMFVNPEGFVIENLTISSSTEIFNGPYGGCNGGLFGSVRNAFIYGIKLENVNIDVSDFDGELFSDAGGIAGMSSNTYFKDCSVTGNLKSNGCAGGISASNSWGIFEDCKFEGNVTVDESLSEYAAKENGGTGAGGIVGYLGSPCYFGVYNYAVKNCTAKGNITAVYNAGGIAGYIMYNEFFKDCAFTGELSGAATGEIFAKKQYNNI